MLPNNERTGSSLFQKEPKPHLSTDAIYGASIKMMVFMEQEI